MKLRIIRSPEHLRDAGMAQVLDHTPEEYKAAFTRVYNRLVDRGRPFTSEDVVELVGLPPGHVNGVGALMSGLLRPDLRSGRVKYLGHIKGTNPKSHASRIGQYQGES